MEVKQIIAVILGLGAGLTFIPVYEGTSRWIVTTWNPVGSALRTIVVFVLATVAASVAVGFIMLVPGYLLGVMPLRGNTAYHFMWPFLAGGLSMRAYIEFRKRR